MSKPANIKELLLSAPEGQLDSWIKEKYITYWSDPPTSLQILEALDLCIWGSLSSGFVLDVLSHQYYQTLATENKTHEDNLPLALWREEMTKTWTNQNK